jgi:hypothetical protein
LLLQANDEKAFINGIHDQSVEEEPRRTGVDPVFSVFRVSE